MEVVAAAREVVAAVWQASRSIREAVATLRGASRRTQATAQAGGRQVIAHVVSFTPRATLTREERQALVGDLERALQAIPEIRRARIGRRKVLGFGYDAVGPVHFEFVLILEFDSEADLRTYLHHPAHVALGRWFHHGAEVALAEDFELADADGVRQLAEG